MTHRDEPLTHGDELLTHWDELLRTARLVDDGWLRVLSAPTTGDRLLGSLEASCSTSRTILGFDVLGGTFALSNEVHYFAPDSLVWEPLGLTGEEWLPWVLGTGPAEVFEGLRWPGWAEETRPLAADQGIAVYPPLWSEEGQDLAAAHRGVVPLLELVTSHSDAARQLAGVGDGESVGIEVIDE